MTRDHISFILGLLLIAVVVIAGSVAAFESDSRFGASAGMFQNTEKAP